MEKHPEASGRHLGASKRRRLEASGAIWEAVGRRLEASGSI
mgnify:CR=1 FL=1